jgi:2-oxoacid:acceptor oxidoreductase delta subunit (pyruvate/2-ketoisovalerate family)
MPKGTGWRDIPRGGLIEEAGNSVEYKTGGWRAFRPVVDKQRCTNCLFFWVFCPDSSILVSDEKMVGFDLEHCKGCGVCAKVCPVHCIDMVEETAFAKEAEK